MSVYHKSIQKNTLELATRAYQIHCEHISSDKRKYDSDFQDWWSSFALDDVFGSRLSWSKWHRAGEAIAKVKGRCEEHSANLPNARDALYAIAQLDEKELRLCLQDTYTRDSITEPQARKRGFSREMATGTPDL